MAQEHCDNVVELKVSTARIEEKINNIEEDLKELKQSMATLQPTIMRSKILWAIMAALGTSGLGVLMFLFREAVK